MASARRMPIKVTRALVTGALDGSLKNVEFRTDKYFGFAVPTSVPGIDTKIAQSGSDLGGQEGVRRNRAQARRHVPEEFHEVRADRRRRSEGRGAADQHRRGIGYNPAPWFTPDAYSKPASL